MKTLKTNWTPISSLESIESGKPTPGRASRLIRIGGRQISYLHSTYSTTTALLVTQCQFWSGCLRRRWAASITSWSSTGSLKGSSSSSVTRLSSRCQRRPGPPPARECLRGPLRCPGAAVGRGLRGPGGSGRFRRRGRGGPGLSSGRWNIRSPTGRRWETGRRVWS